MCAKRILFLSHTERSREEIPTGMGEIANSVKLRNLMREKGIDVPQVVDIFGLFGGVEKTYEPLALINQDLAQQGHAILQEVRLPETSAILEKIQNEKADINFILSWHWSLGALFAMGAHKVRPTVSKFYVHDELEKVMPSLYQPSDLLLTESLLASRKGEKAGIPPWKMIYFPHHYPKAMENALEGMDKRPYLENVAQRNGKELHLNEKTVVIGVVSRLDWGKNVDFALSAVERLVAEGEDVLLVIKGRCNEDDAYGKWMAERMAGLKEASWLLWDEEVTPIEKAVEQYATFDLFVHLSGAEAGSNVIVEFLALGTPTVILEASTNPSLFRKAAQFVKETGEIRPGLLSFRVPDEDDLLKTLRHLVHNREAREKLGREGREVALRRFHPDRTLERLPLIFEAAEAYHHGKETPALKAAVEELYASDLREYGY